jgi:hypothetical protein
MLMRWYLLRWATPIDVGMPQDFDKPDSLVGADLVGDPAAAGQVAASTHRR